MGAPAVDISTGFTIAFGTSGFTAQILDVTPPGSERESIETSHQGTVTWKTFLPADLVNNGELEFTGHHNPDTDPPIDGATEQVTLTFPSDATWVFQGFMTGYKPSWPFEDKGVFTATIKVTGAITITPGHS